jgi:hypothetical protein
VPCSRKENLLAIRTKKHRCHWCSDPINNPVPRENVGRNKSCPRGVHDKRRRSHLMLGVVTKKHIRNDVQARQESDSIARDGCRAFTLFSDSNVLHVGHVPTELRAHNLQSARTPRNRDHKPTTSIVSLARRRIGTEGTSSCTLQWLPLASWRCRKTRIGQA